MAATTASVDVHVARQWAGHTPVVDVAPVTACSMLVEHFTAFNSEMVKWCSQRRYADRVEWALSRGRTALSPSRIRQRACCPPWASEITSCTPDRPRATSPRRNAVHPGTVLGGDHIDPQRLAVAVGVHPDRMHDGDVDDAAALADCSRTWHLPHRRTSDLPAGGHETSPLTDSRSPRPCP